MAHYQYEGQHYQLPDGLSNDEAIGKIKTHLGQATSKAGFTPGTIPGQEGEAERVAGLKAARKAQPGEEKLKDIIGGGIETLGAIGTGIYAGVQAPIAAGMKRATGMVPDWEKETARLMEENIYAPRTEKGQEYTAAFGDVANRYLAPFGLSGPRALAGLPDLVGRAKLKQKLGKEPVAPAVVAADREALIRGKQPAPVAEPAATPAQEIRVGKDGEAYVSTPETEFAREAAANRMVDENERIYNEQQQQNLFAMPERAYQEDLPFHSSVEDIAAKQAEGQPQVDMFAGNELPQTPESLARQQELNILNQKEQMFNARPQTDEFVQQRQAQEQAKLTREEQLQGLEQQLTESAYSPQGKGQGPKTRNFNKFGQGGAIDPRIFEDMYNFGKSVLRGDDGNLRPLYHGTENEFRNIKASTQGGALGNGVYLAIRPEYASGYADGNGGNVHQVYANITNPLIIDGPGDPMINALVSLGETREKAIKIVEKAYDDKGYITNEVKSRAVKKGHDGIIQKRNGIASEVVAFNPEQVKSALSADAPAAKINKFGQGGQAPMIGELAEGIVKLGKGLKAKFTGVVPPQPDTILTPRSEATIAAKVEKGSKAAAIGMKDSPYISPSTIEEVVANPGKDLSGITQEMGAGMYAAIRRNSPNRMLAFTNRLFTDARLNKIKDSVQYITGKEGYNNKLTKLSAKEKQILHMDSLVFDREAIPFTHEKAVELGYTPAMEEFMNQRMAANDRVANLADGVLSKQGQKLLDRRVSYAAANFDGAYRTLVGKWVGEGKDRTFKIDTVVNGNSLWELREGVKWAKENVPGAEFLELPRRGLNTEPVRKFKGVQQDSMARLLSELADMDPKFAEAKSAVDAHIQAQTKKLYGHDVHALEKKGVRGAIGNRPWLDAARNAEDFFKQEVNHIEEGLQYWNYQDAINDVRSMTARPELGHMKNTTQYIDKYLQNIHGQGLNPVGAAINWMVDHAFASTGYGSASTSKGVMNAAREAASLWMMGMFNTAFPVIQLSQFLTGMTPEAMRIRSEFGLSPITVATSLGNSTFTLSLIAAADLMGKPMGAFPSHLVEAYKWAKEHGITQYNEVEQSHSATQNPKWSKVKDIAGLPISVPERITGPQTFMWAVDMLHEAGLRGDDLYRAAYNSSKHAMTEYHPDEAPLVYQRLGVVGPNVGGLKKFVHNAIDQQFARYGEAFKHPGAATTLLGMTLLTAGATGLMGTAMLDKASLSLTDKGLRDHWDDVMGKSVTSRGVRDGFTSALTGFDVQSRYSLADVVPGSFAEAVAGPHLSMLAKTATAILAYGLNPSEQTFREAAKAATPSGMKGMLEEGYMLGEQGQVLDKNAMNKYPPEMSRTPTEHAVRKYGGPKPLRERLYDEQKYQADVVQRKIEKKRSEAVTKLTASMGFKDPEGFKKAMTDFINAEGDVSTLENSIKKYYEQQMLSSKQRAGGLEPKASLPSIKKWERYQEKQ